LVKIKFCGITNTKDAVWASNFGVDFIGLNFVKNSPRKISIEQAKKIISSIPEFILTAGVFSIFEIKNILKTAKKLNLDYIQLHGDENIDYVKDLKNNNLKLIKCIKVYPGINFEEYLKFIDYIDYFLLDTKTENLEGGTGETFNWDMAIEFKKITEKPFFLAGGLNPQNITEAVKKVEPFGVDVASGIEKSPRSKDYKKMQEFIKNAQ